MGGQDVAGPTLPAALLVVGMGAAIFTFGSFGVRAGLPGSRALQVVGGAVVIMAMAVIFSTV